MVTQIKVRAVINEDRQLVVELPDGVPIGPVELVIRPLAIPPARSQPLTREVARARLLAAGLLSTTRYAPPDAVPLSDEELEALARRLPSRRQSIDEMLDEDRGLFSQVLKSCIFDSNTL